MIDLFAARIVDRFSGRIVSSGKRAASGSPLARVCCASTIFIGLLLLVGITVPAQDSKGVGAIPPADRSGTPETPAQHLPPIQFDSSAVLHHLNQVISWYRHSTTGVQSVGIPSDTIYQDNTRNLAAQAVKLAFQSVKGRKTMRIVRQNLFWAFFYNALGITLAVVGLLNPILAACAMLLSSLSVVGNSMRLARAESKLQL
jgi:hypothetical protein